MKEIKTYDELVSISETLFNKEYKNTFNYSLKNIKESGDKIFNTNYELFDYIDTIYISIDDNKKEFTLMPRRIKKMDIDNSIGSKPYTGKESLDY